MKLQIKVRKELLSMFTIEKPDFTAQLNDKEWCPTVSYTHLDVYKRQILITGKFFYILYTTKRLFMCFGS